MARANIAKHFLKEYEEALKNTDQYIGTGGLRLLDCTFRINEVATQMVKGLDEIIAPAIADVSQEDYGPQQQGFYRTKELWEEIGNTITQANLQKICKERFALIKAGAKPPTGANTGTLVSGLPGGQRKIARWQDFRERGFRGTGTFVLGRTKGGAGITFRFVRVDKKGGGDGSLGFMHGATREHILDTAAIMRHALYNDWLRKHASKVAKQLEYKATGSSYLPTGPLTKSGKPDMRYKENRPIQPYRSEVIAKHTNIAHEKGSEVGIQGLRWLREQVPSVNFPYTITVNDIIDQIESSTGIIVSRASKKTKLAGYNWEFVSKTSIRENFPGSEVGDVINIKSKELMKAINKIILKSPRHWKLFFTRGSVTPAKQVVDDTVRDMIRPLTKTGRPDKRYKINRKPKKFKPSKDAGIVVKKPKPVKSKIGRGVALVAGKTKKFKVRTDRQVEKGAGRAASTTNAAELAMTKKYIQGRLPAEVRRNMGRPQLISRTGQFSESVRLLSLTPAANSVVAKYTYTLTGGGSSKNKNKTGVYSTFENSGRWPQAYNPKPLIAKSIRNLAKGRIEEKLTTRRV